MTHKTYAILLIGTYPDIVNRTEGDEGNLINVSGKVTKSDLNQAKIFYLDNMDLA